MRMQIQTGDYLSIPQIKVLRQLYYIMVIESLQFLSIIQLVCQKITII